MTGNFVEEFVAEYFRFQGYIVTTNYWFPKTTTRHRIQRGKNQKYQARSWSDIDVMALNKDELVLVQVKCLLNKPQAPKDVLDFFHKVDDFLKNGKALDGKSSIQWWSEGRKIRKLLVYECYSPGCYITPLKENGIEVQKFDEMFQSIAQYVAGKAGSKEENPLMRFVHFLKDNRYLKKN